jgi:hypothetical protein
VLVLDAHNTTSPCASQLIVLVVLLAECLFECFEIFVVLLSNIGQSNACGSLHVHDGTEVSLTANKAVWNVAFTAECWEEDNHFNGVDIMSNHDQFGTLLFNELSDVVKTELNVHRLGPLLCILIGSRISKTVLLFFSRLRAVFMQEFKQFTGLVAFDGVVELSNAWRDLQTLHQNSLLPLNSDVFWPPDETGEVSLRLDVSSDSKVSWVLFE